MSENIFSRILVAVDDNAPARDALVLAARLAREHGGRLFMCHSVNWLPMVSEAESTGAIIDPVPIIDGLKQAGRELLAQAAVTAQRIGCDAEERPAEGDPSDSIVKIAGECGCGLIVMGTHGRSGLGEFFIGSTTEAVLRRSPVPVLTVRPGTAVAAEPRRCFERVMVGMDDSEPADAALETLFALPLEDRRQVLLYSIADIDSVIGARGEYRTAIRDDIYDQARQVLERARASARAHDIAAEAQIGEGNPADALVEAAKGHGEDLIVVGSHGRRGARRFFLGSVAERIVRTSPVPVLVVRAAEKVPAVSYTRGQLQFAPA